MIKLWSYDDMIWKISICLWVMLTLVMLLIVMLLGCGYDRRWWWWIIVMMMMFLICLDWIKVSKMMIAYVIWISIIMCYVCLCWEDELGLCLCDAMVMAYVMRWCYRICWWYVIVETWVCRPWSKCLCIWCIMWIEVWCMLWSFYLLSLCAYGLVA